MRAEEGVWDYATFRDYGQGFLLGKPSQRIISH